MTETYAVSFRIRVKWLYTGRIFLVKEGDTKEEEFTRWGNCYALGDFLQDSDFGDACINTLPESIRTFAAIPSDLPVWIYNHSTNDSQYRKLVVDLFATCAAPDTWTCNGKAPREFLVDLVDNVGLQIVDGRRPIERNTITYVLHGHGCDYHDHDSANSCYKISSGFRF
jgi:hypothetical protein